MFAHPYNLSPIQKELIENIEKNANKINFYNGVLDEKIINPAYEVLPSCVAIVSDEFGSAICISEKGYILCCAHSAYYDIDIGEATEILMMFPTGEQVVTKIVKRDEDLDLAVVKIIKSKNGDNSEGRKYPSAKLYQTVNGDQGESYDDPIFCIGNPCFLDMGNLKTGDERNDYLPFWTSQGKVLGYMEDKVYGNISLGPLKHSCWTYWGHSGAPLFNLNGEIIGLHNSWDEKTGTRHGISILGINKFLSDLDL